jgi:receptor-type tyrosine-protein phosphatase gamma
MVSEVMAEAGTNMSIGCPGITRNTFVVHLEWRCRGQCGGMGGTVYGGGSNGDNDVKLLKYVKDQTTAILKSKNRLRLEPEMFALEFDPISSEDKGQYLCLINNRPIPDAVIKLMVLGKLFKFHVNIITNE